jgi:membrane protein DedA with SNARE-associated domain
MFAHLESLLISLSHSISIELFAFLASFVEEVVAPIPSPTVMVVTGTLAKLASYGYVQLFTLALLGALGKTLGGLIVYWIAHKAENFILVRFSRFFGITHSDIERLSRRLSGGFRDYFTLTFLRALPIMPSVVVSAGSGILQIRLGLFIISTFFGTIIRDSFYLYAGYVGVVALNAFVSASSRMETIIEYGFIAAIICFIAFKIYRKRLRQNFE